MFKCVTEIWRLKWEWTIVQEFDMDALLWPPSWVKTKHGKPEWVYLYLVLGDTILGNAPRAHYWRCGKQLRDKGLLDQHIGHPVGAPSEALHCARIDVYLLQLYSVAKIPCIKTIWQCTRLWEVFPMPRSPLFNISKYACMNPYMPQLCHDHILTANSQWTLADPQEYLLVWSYLEVVHVMGPRMEDMAPPLCWISTSIYYLWATTPCVC